VTSWKLMQKSKYPNILLGVCGGIAAYKTVELVRQLKQQGANVQVIMTESAQDFIGSLTFQALTGNPVWTQKNDQSFERAMAHIDLSRWADLLIIAPMTANFLAKMAHGFTDDLLSLVVMMAQVPVLVCPAMNKHMWQHPATVENIQTLRDRGIVIVGPDVGEQACGDVGYGRMREPEWIIHAIEMLPVYQKLEGQSFLVTAGPTREMIDPVRFISNRSSGLMGYALAEALAFAGANVTLISGVTALPCPPNVKRIVVESAADMDEAVQAHLKRDDVFIGVAAVSDYTVKTPGHQKIKKNQQAELMLELSPTRDILKAVKESGYAKKVIGFAAETEHVLEHARKKLQFKADMIIANQVGIGLVFEQPLTAATIVTQDQEIEIAQNSKLNVACEIIQVIKTFIEQ
jgi:phosphopantothenoylcysteine decarboxylase / phosphopantothenate---cysteine ligase